MTPAPRSPAGRPPRRPRRGAILLVVLSLLALFAVIGLSFVLYAESQSNAARARKQAEADRAATVPPSAFQENVDTYLNRFLADLIYDVNPADATYATNPTPLTSGINGHSLARAKYGWNASTPSSMLSPFNGLGVFSGSTATISGVPRDQVVNYAFQPGSGVIADAEYPTARTSPTALPVSTDYRNVSAPYTYPDAKDLYLAVLSTSSANFGEVLQPSFHRDWMFALSTSSGTGDWTSAAGRLKFLRPRPKDHEITAGDSQFPYPPKNFDGTVTGDVQNLPGGSGKMDSIWVYPAGPIGEWNGTKYTACIAALVIDLGGRVNLATAGNLKGTGTTHASGAGLGPWEVNPRWVFEPNQTTVAGLTTQSTTALQQLLSAATTTSFAVAGTTSTIPTPGRYGTGAGATTPQADQLSSQAFLSRLSINPGSTYIVPKRYAPLDAGTGGSTNVLSAVGTATSPFPTVVNTRYYDSTNAATVLGGHPGQINPAYQIASTTGTLPKKFAPESALWQNHRIGGRAEAYARSDAARLLPNVLLAANAGFSTTPSSAYDTTKPPFSPLYMTATGTPTGVTYNASNPGAAGRDANNLPNDPTNLVRLLTTTHGKTTHRPEVQIATSSSTGTVPLGPIDLGRTLPDYRTDPTQTWSPDSVYDGSSATQATHLQTVQSARQNFARDIYVRLLAAANLLTTANAANVSYDATNGYPKVLTAGYEATLKPYAQLAANMVDQIDADDVATPFVWHPYTAFDGTGTFESPTTYPLTIAAADVPTRMVFGTELPRLVVNEAYSALVNDPTDPKNGGTLMNGATLNFQIKFWIEFLNPLSTDDQLPDSGAARLHNEATVSPGAATQTFSPYQIVVVPTGMKLDAMQAIGDLPATITGTPNLYLQVGKNGATDYAYDGMGAVLTGDNLFQVKPASGAASGTPASNEGYYVVGPAEPHPDAAVTPSLKLRTPAMAPMGMDPPAASMTLFATDKTDALRAMFAAGTLKYAVVLRRLANPYLQHQPDPTAAQYNPYLAVDAFDEVTPKDRVTHVDTGPATSTPSTDPSTGRNKHPYAGTTATAVGFQAMAPFTDPPKHTFFNANVDTAGAALTAPLAWLTHLDRAPVSPPEIASTSVAAPYELTTTFFDDTQTTNKYNRHTAERLLLPGTAAGATTFGGAAVTEGALYKALDLLATRPYYSQTAVGAPQVGRINLNAVQHESVLRALFDPQQDGTATAPFGAGDVSTFWSRLTSTTGTRAARSPSFPSTSTADVPLYGIAGSTALTNTVLRNNGAGVEGLFSSQVAAGTPEADHVYARTDPLKKVWNNAATTSDTFLVIMTIGFFEVRREPTATQPIILGKELFQNAPGDLRLKYATVIDRSHLGVEIDTANANVKLDANWKNQQPADAPWFSVTHTDVPAGQPNSNNVVIDAKYTSATRCQVFANGSTVDIDTADATKRFIRLGSGDASLNQGEGGLYTVTAVDNTDTAGTALPQGQVRLSVTRVGSGARTLYHPSGSMVSNVLLGNPGPQKNFRYDLDRYKHVVIVPPTKID